MKLWSDSFKDGSVIPGEFAFGVIDPAAHVALSSNRNPHLAWSDLPAGTKSLALICHDVDVPSRGDDVNQEGKSVPADLPRVDFFHWVLVDLPANLPSVAAGQHSSSVTPRGKPGPDIAGGGAGRHALSHGEQRASDRRQRHLGQPTRRSDGQLRKPEAGARRHEHAASRQRYGRRAA